MAGEHRASARHHKWANDLSRIRTTSTALRSGPTALGATYVGAQGGLSWRTRALAFRDEAKSLLREERSPRTGARPQAELLGV
jgi:hypothetical protein